MGQDRVEERFKVSQAQKDKFEQELEQLDQKISRFVQRQRRLMRV